MLMLMCPLVFAMPLCEDTPTISNNCTMVTPVITCSNYNYTILNTTGHHIESGNLSHLNSSVYYFNFSQPSGQYIVVLCDGGLREVIVEEDENTMIAVAITFGIIGTLFFYLGYKMLNDRAKDDEDK